MTAPTPRRTARVAGLAYLLIFVCGLFAEMAVRGALIVPGDLPATVANLRVSPGLFRLGLAADLVMLIGDVVVGVALYLLLAQAGRMLALLAFTFRLVHTAVYGAGLVGLLGVPHLLADPGNANEALIGAALRSQGYGYTVGLVFFGFACLALGALVLRSGMFPRVLGALLMVAGLGYLVDSFAQVLLANYDAYADVLGLVVFIPAFVGELAFAVWLVAKGPRAARDLRP